MTKNITPMKRLKDHLNVFHNHIESITDFKELSKRKERTSNDFRNSQKEISNDKIFLFNMHNNKSFAFNFFYLNDNERVVEKEQQHVEITYKHKGVESFCSLQITVDEFKDSLSKLNKKIDLGEKDRFEASDYICELILSHFNLRSAIVENEELFFNTLQDNLSLEFSNLSISNTEINKLESELLENDKILSHFSYHSPEALAVKEMKKQLKEAENAFDLAYKKEKTKLRINEKEKMAKDSRFMKSLLIQQIKTEAQKLNKKLRIPSRNMKENIEKLFSTVK